MALNGRTYKGIVYDEIDYGEAEKKLALFYKLLFTNCICTHSNLAHKGNKDGKCNVCNCKGFGETNLDWLAKNGKI